MEEQVFTREFIPTVCTEHERVVDVVEGKEVKKLSPPIFEGKMVVKLLSYEERYELPEKLGIEDLVGNDISEETKREKFKKNLDNLRFLRKAYAVIKPFLVSCELKHIASGTEIKTIPHLEHFEEASEIISEVIFKYVNGFAEKK